MKILIALLFLSLNSFAAEQVFPTGTLSTDIKWTTNDMGSDALAARLSFKPVQAKSCKRLSFIQIARVQTSPGMNYQWQEYEGQANRNSIRTRDGYFIDHDASQCEKGKFCSPYYRDSWQNPDESSETATETSMFDAPYGWDKFESIELEACVVCEGKGMSLSTLACVAWGGKWPATGDRKILPITFAATPSDSFIKALSLFQRFY